MSEEIIHSGWEALARNLVLAISVATGGCGAFQQKSVEVKPDPSELFRKKMDCAKVGEQAVKKFNYPSDAEELAANARGLFWNQPVYGYSESLNTCLIATENFSFDETGSPGTAWSYEATIFDVLNNRNVANCELGLLAGAEDNDKPWPEFVATFKKVFGQDPPTWIAKDPGVEMPAKSIAWRSVHDLAKATAGIQKRIHESRRPEQVK
jgi:hypothetical protein